MTSSAPAPEDSSSKNSHSWRFWAIILSLSIASVLSTLDVSVISTAMPSIIKDLGSTNIFGRRSLTLLAVFLFAAGSAMSGPAPNLTVLITGRVIKGISRGDINILIEIIVVDLVPLRERPNYISIIFITYIVAVVLGPFIGGVLLALLFRVRYIKDSAQNSLRRVDFGGNAFLIISVVSVFLALIWGGVEFLWLSIFSNRTSVGGFAMTFIYLFQVVLECDSTILGVNLFSFVAVFMPFVIAAGIGISKIGRYRSWFFLGTSAFALLFGLYSRLNENYLTAYWAGVQCIGVAGAATWGFVRSFGGVWGVAILAVIFNSRVNVRVEDLDIRRRLANGGAYALATGDFMASLNRNPDLKATVKSVYVDSLKLFWQVAIGFSLLGLLIGMTIKEITLRTDLQTEFGLERD
ncbi:putative multidrug resistance protein fnx1 [Biscogniauxia marginata]|nr:putative multidrug resistance protein fnx1 [Biscogniauxia marginata]